MAQDKILFNTRIMNMKSNMKILLISCVLSYYIERLYEYISGVRWDDRGKYRCSAINAAGKDSVIGVLKVEKSPQLYTKTEIVDLATKPVQIDCSVSGFPVINSSDIVELKVINKTSNIHINIEDTIYNEMDGLQVIYEVGILKKQIEEETYFLECVYKPRKIQKQSKIIELRIVNSPDTPNVIILCTGSSGIVFEYVKPIVTKSSKNVTKNQVFYAPSSEYDTLDKKPTKIIPLNNDDSKSFVYVLKSLMPDTDYFVKWESFNAFQISSFTNFSVKTKQMFPPNTPKSMNFSTKRNSISVTLKWDDECPYDGTDSPVEDIVVKIKSLNTVNENVAQNWNWVERNFSVDVRRRNLQFPIYLDIPQIDYEITVGLRSKQGISGFITAIYRANVVLAGSLFSCFPRCLGQSLLSSLTVIKLALIAVVVFLHML